MLAIHFYFIFHFSEVNGNIFAAQITVKEGTDQGKRFYLQRLQIREPAVTRGAGDAQAQSAALQRSGSPINIAQLLRDVKSEDAPAETPAGPDIIETLYQDALSEPELPEGVTATPAFLERRAAIVEKLEAQDIPRHIKEIMAAAAIFPFNATEVEVGGGSSIENYGEGNPGKSFPQINRIA
jgi:hypothetical protein